MAGNGRTNVGTHDDSDCLAEFKDSGVYKANGDYRGRAGTLYYCGYNRAEGNAFPDFSGKLFKNFGKLVSGHFFNARAEHMHSEKEKGKAAHG